MLAALRQSWRVAAERTPHGQPIVLGAAARAIAGRDGATGAGGDDPG